MAKSSKDKDRRAVIEQMRREQQRAEKKRSALVFGVVGLVALAIIAVPAYQLITDNQKQDELAAKGLDEIGAPAAQAGCQDVEAAPASGSADHRPEGSKLLYDEAPPASGSHYPTWAPMERKFYTAQDRPALGYLVHNLEHGYSILWYDETVAEDEEMLADVEAIAKKFSGSDFENKFIAAPWTPGDGGEFPEGKHVALTHWSMGGTNGNPDGQLGIWQYCAEPSGEAVSQFVQDYPYQDSPEPTAS